MNNIAFSSAAERNSQPILQVLQQILPGRGRALEIASGTGQHLAYFGTALPQWDWQPSDAIQTNFAGISARIGQAGCSNVRPPVLLDVREARWPALGTVFDTQFDLIFCANMIHIAPWDCCAGLMQGCSQHLAADGRLVTYGPYFESGVTAAPGNLAFDQDLRARNPAWGIRSLQDVAAQAQQVGLHLLERHAMPANNLLLVWGRADG